jgi:hypothetical protein
MITLKTKNFLVAGITVLLMAIASYAFADDITDSINEALDAYDEGEYTAAVESLNYASQLINQKKSNKLSSILPEPIKGWTAKSSTSQAVGAAMFGGGITAQRKYIKGNNNISIEIVADSPILQSMMMMFSNPMYATSDGGKLEKINRQKAIVKFNPDTKRGDINIVVAKRFLVTVKGNKTTIDDLKAYAKAIDYKMMKSLE